MPRDWILPGTGNTAVKIGGDDEDFYQSAATSLNELNATVAGNALLTTLANRRNGANPRFVTIKAPTDAGARNECGGIPSPGVDMANHVADGRTLLAQALVDANGDIPAEIQACLTAMGHPGDYDWLANAVNSTPVYNIVGMPATAPSNIGLTANHVRDWTTGATNYPAPLPAAARDNLTLLLLTVLWPGSRTRPGAGVHSVVRWNTTRRQVTLTTGVVLAGSESVSLGHELTHALYNGEGTQLGNDYGHFSTVLYEYMCVGFGPWASEPCTENQYRAQWTPALQQRPCY